MKKQLSFFLVLMLLLGCVGCAAEQTSTTPARKLLAEYRVLAQDNSLSALELAERMTESSVFDTAMATVSVEPGYLNGLTEEIGGFSEGAMFGPAIGAIPFVGYILRTDSAAAARELAQRMEETSDLRWNICTQADELVCEAVGPTVFFVMSPASFDE